MVLMALDHVRDFFGPTSFLPEDPTATTPAWFFTRWITHFCAPVFVFLAGTSAFLYQHKGRSRLNTAKFLLSRGVWLIFVEIAIINPSWMLTAYSAGFFLFAQVIWAIGWSMIALALLIWLPLPLIAALSATMIAGHNLLDDTFVDAGTLWGRLLIVLHGGAQGFMLTDSLFFATRYPLVPWIGVMALGYSFGAIVTQCKTTKSRARAFFWIGLSTTTAFIVIRWLNIYGDPNPWGAVEGRGRVYTVLSFLNCEKYPPSLSFLLMTLGPALMVLAALERWEPSVLKPILVFGRVPMFYYLLHVPLIHLGAYALAKWDGRTPGWWWMAASGFPIPEYEPNLRLVYGVWIAVVVLLFPVCVWYAGVKRRHPNWLWMRYL